MKNNFFEENTMRRLEDISVSIMILMDFNEILAENDPRAKLNELEIKRLNKIRELLLDEVNTYLGLTQNQKEVI
jgi:hypothetical protein